MSVNQKIAPLTPISCSSASSAAEMDVEDPEVIVLHSFKLKPVGAGGPRNTLVENDSLSSYSLPEETSRPNRAKQHPGEKTGNGERTITTKLLNAESKTVIDINNIGNIGSIREPTYVEAYMQFMYWTCISPFNPAGSRCGPGSTYEWCLGMGQKMTFAIISSLAIIQAILDVKYFFIYNLAYSSLDDFVDLAFFIISACTKMYYVYLFVQKQNKIKEMQKSFHKLRAFVGEDNVSKRNHLTTLTYSLTLGICSILVSLIQTIWSAGITDWTPKTTILFHSYQMATDVYLWKPDNVKNSTWIDELKDEYGTDLTTKTALFGTIRMAYYFCGSIQMDATANLMISYAETIKHSMRNLETKISDPNNDITNISLAEFLKENGDWAHSQLLNEALKEGNDTLDPLLKYKHINNLTLFVFFIMNIFEGNFGIVYMGYWLYNIVKSSYMYRIATDAAGLNDARMDWIQRLAWKTQDKSFLDRVPLILGELERKQIGMGKGQFMINESFLYRFLGWVGSVFVLQAQSREGNAG